MEKCPLNCKLVRNIEWLNPLKMIENFRVCIDQLTRCVHVMCNAGKMRADKCDKAMVECKNFLEEKKEAIAKYDGGRLDQCFLCIFLLQVCARTYGSLLKKFFYCLTVKHLLCVFSSIKIFYQLTWMPNQCFQTYNC